MTDISMIDVQEEPTLGMRRRVRLEDLKTFFDSVFSEVFGALQQAGVHPAGAPFARYYGEPATEVDVEAGFPVSGPCPATGDLVSGTLPAARAVEAVHVGAYDALPGTYEQIRAWANERNLQLLDEMWERYESGPASDPDPAAWRTRIIWPVMRPQVEAADTEGDT